MFSISIYLQYYFVVSETAAGSLLIIINIMTMTGYNSVADEVSIIILRVLLLL